MCRKERRKSWAKSDCVLQIEEMHKQRGNMRKQRQEELLAKKNTSKVFLGPSKLTEPVWRAYEAEKVARGLKTKTVSLVRAANGPIIANLWESNFARSMRPSWTPSSLLSVHFNCNTKRMLLRDHNAASWLYQPQAARDTSMK